MRGWAGMGLAVLAGGVWFAATAGDDVRYVRTPAKRLVEMVSRHARAEPVATELGGTLTFPTLGISLWRMVVDNTPRFESVLVSAPKRPRS
ncbi:MAG: hypothetical protein Q8K79_20900 [Solirubrobacteraceae bacterium]|nr:hypothetical protein [Solirubrobacteraceae bacterium]